MTPQINIVVAASDNQVIGKDNQLVWNLPNDMKFFKNTTWGMPVIMGRKTYDWVMKQVPEFPHADKKSYIITRASRPALGNVNFYNGNLPDLIRHLKSKEGNNIFIDGGAEIVNLLLRDSLIDEFIISIIPVFVGSGTRLFSDDRIQQNIILSGIKHFDTGLVQLHYTSSSK